MFFGWTAAVYRKSTNIPCRVQNVQAVEAGSKGVLRPQFCTMASRRKLVIKGY